MASNTLLFLSASSSVDFFGAIRQNDICGIACLVVLGILSLWSWTLIMLKLRDLYHAKRESKAFQRLVDTDGSWEALFLAAKRYRSSPTAKLLKETYVECRLENWFDSKGELGTDGRLDMAKATIEGILQRTMADEETRLQGQMTGIATVTTLAPFIGLFGTVWGVLGSFQALGREGSAALTALAPGVSTALMTTVFGLIAAIPALVFHNYFSREIFKLMGSMEVFSHHIENAVRKRILSSGGRGG